MRDEQSNQGISQAYNAAIQRLGRWRTVFIGWMLGTVPQGTPGLMAQKDRIDAQLMYRVEINALTALLIKKGIFTTEEFMLQVVEECGHKHEELERLFPGYKATNSGITIDVALAQETNKRMGFPP